MKSLLKLCLLLGVFCASTPMFSQDFPQEEGLDYCDCLEGIQTIHDACDCTSTGGTNTNTNTNNNNTNNTNTGGPTETGSNNGGSTATGNFPLVFSWLQCFFDPDCTP